jgi:hypothetical protein
VSVESAGRSPCARGGCCVLLFVLLAILFLSSCWLEPTALARHSGVSLELVAASTAATASTATTASA